MPPLMAATPNVAASLPSKPSMFVGAPATKIWAAILLLCFLLIHAQNAVSVAQYDTMRRHEWYRLFSSKLTFAGSPGELFFGGFPLLYLMRRFEREMGTRKFSAFCFLVTTFVIAVEWLVLLRADNRKEGHLQYMGPYGLLAACVFLFHVYTPRLHPRFFVILGFAFSEKSIQYIWMSQVFVANWNLVAIPSLAGAVAAFLCTRLSSYDLPDSVVRLLQPWLEYFAERPAPALVPTGANRAAHPIFGQVQQNQRNALHPPHHQPQQQQPSVEALLAQQRAQVEPDPAAIEQLTSMGFPRDQVIEALRYCDNNVQHAAERLLGQG